VDELLNNVTRACVQGNPRTGRAVVGEHTVQLLDSLLEADRRWTSRELAVEVGLCHKRVLHILHDILRFRQIAARWVPYDLTEVQQWHRHVLAQVLLDRCHRDGDAFLQRVITMDETWARSYEPRLKRQSNESKHQGSPCPKKVRPQQGGVKVMFIVAHDVNGVILPTLYHKARP
jgi:hypothetical protein